MTVKLNLTMDEKAVAIGKKLAAKRNKSLSKMLEEYILMENKKNEKNISGLLKYAGILSGELHEDKVEKILDQRRKKYGY
jgi:hypothetical protein